MKGIRLEGCTDVQMSGNTFNGLESDIEIIDSTDVRMDSNKHINSKNPVTAINSDKLIINNIRMEADLGENKLTLEEINKVNQILSNNENQKLSKIKSVIHDSFTDITAKIIVEIITKNIQ